MFGKKRKKYKYINGTRGVISIFLALLMVPFTVVAGALIDTGRIYSAVAIFDEALCNASNSTLGTYDSFLKKRFGLLAIKQNNNGELTEKDAQEFINGIFKDYMAVNCSALPGTYDEESVTTHADGIYPLADYSVLKNQILEYSKYQIPAKFVKDSINLEDFFKDLEKSLPGYDLFDKITKGFNAANKVIDIGNAINELKNKTASQKTADENYELAYTAFKEAYESYLAQKETVESLKTAKEEAYDEWQAALLEESQAQSSLSSIESELTGIETQISDLESGLTDESLSDEDKAALNSSIESLQSQKSSLESQQNDLNEIIGNSQASSKEEAYNDAKEQYDEAVEQLNVLKATVEEKASVYSGTVSTLKSMMSDVVDAKKELMENAGDLIDMGVTSIQEEQSESRKQNIKVAKGLTANKDKELEELRGYYNSSKDDAEKSAIDASIKHTQKYRDAYDDRRIELERNQFVSDSSKDLITDAIDGVVNADKIEDETQYDAMDRALDKLKGNIDGFNCEDPSPEWSESNYHADMSNLLTEEEVDEYQKDIVKKVVNDGVIGFLTKVVQFWKKIMNLGLPYNPVLNANIDSNYYASMGGLPSSKAQSAFESKYSESDKLLSDRYKSEMTSYSDVSSGYTGNLLDDIDKLISNIKELFNAFGEFKITWNLIEVGRKILSIVECASAIVDNLITIVKNFSLHSLFDALKSKALISGYLYYNMSNRISYDSFYNKDGLAPLFDVDTKSGEELSFKGAELEYILYRNLSEKSNQQSAFWSIYVMRMLFNFVPVISSDTVRNFANLALEIPYVGPVLYFLVYIFYALAEPLIDTMILCGGGKISLIKNDLYLTPDGIDDLINDVSNIEVKEEEKEAAQAVFTNFNEDNSEKTGVLSSPVQKDENDKKFKIDYQLILLMYSMFKPEKEILTGISDIIQMECSQNAAKDDKTQKFDLTYSYTYLRASGSFKENMFMPLSNKDKLQSQERIIYQGY